MDNHQEYVVGFMFNPVDSFEFIQKVALIKKEHPDWQKGKFNGIGGKVEAFERPISAMVREFGEETGLYLNLRDWRQFASLEGYAFKVYFYYTFGKLEQLQTKTDEEVVIVSVKDITEENSIPNLKWLIPMALNRAFDRDRARSFIIHEL